MCEVVKIGMPRCLDPTDRVRELGSASVPFPFDTHALYFSDDAITLENALHTAFTGQRLNHANLRREFFFATPARVRDVLAAHVGNLLEYTDQPEATQYFQSRSNWPAGAATGRPLAVPAGEVQLEPDMNIYGVQDLPVCLRPVSTN
ncbi:GIY-YIG nuclease family protein [Rhodococcus koreensis]